jgi:low temperature requirement protein LtrA
MLPPSEAPARYRIQDLLDEAEHARLVARLRSLQRARRHAAEQVSVKATPTEDVSVRPAEAHQKETGSTELRVSTIELFFDLVFVFAITQLTNLLAGDPTVAGLGRVLLIFGNLWWIYGGYAWLTNAVPPRAPPLRLLMLLGMGGFLVVALAIPTAFAGSGVLFGFGYLLVTLVHTGMFLLSSRESAVRAMRRLGPANAITAALLLLAGFTRGPLQWTLWTAAFGLHWVSPFFTAVPGFPIRAAHFVERHGLIVLIGLGESIVAVGIGVAGHQPQTDTVVTAVLGLTVAAALWWLYFDGEDERAEGVLDAAPVERASWLALYGFGYAFLPVLGGIIVFAAGVKEAVAQFGGPVNASTAWLLAGGVATYLVGLAWFRQLLDIGPIGARLAMAAAVLPSAMIGLAVSPEAQLGVLAAVVTGGALAESAWKRRKGQRARRPQHVWA